MIPKGLIDTSLSITDEIQISRTYKVMDNKIQGFTDELQALKQAIYKELNTARYEYPIYSFSYGIDLESLIGKDMVYVKIELKRRIQECLLKDERITSVDNFQFEAKGDELICTFEVISIYGKITMNKGVNL